MSKTIAVVVVLLFGLGLAGMAVWNHVHEQPALAATVPENGFPIPYILMSRTQTAEGTRIIYQTCGLCPTESSDTGLCGDAGYEGQKGTYVDPALGKRIWICVPEGTTLSAYRKHLPTGAPYYIPEWAGQLSDWMNAHPDVSIVRTSQTIYQVAQDGGYEPVDHWQRIPPPVSCSPASYRFPFVLRFEAVLSGDVSTLQTPAEIDGALYVVPEAQ